MKKKKKQALEQHLDFTIRQTQLFLENLTFVIIEAEDEQRAAELRIAIGILEDRLEKMKAIETIEEMKIFFDVKKSVYMAQHAEGRNLHDI